MKWVTIKRFSEINNGYTENAIRAKIKKGIWLMDQHWRKAPDGRIFICPEAIDAWVEGH